MSCVDCKYGVSIQKELGGVVGIPLGECHYNSPHPAWFRKQHSTDIHDQIISWPLTKSSDFCSDEEGKLSEEPIKPKGLFANFFSKGS